MESFLKKHASLITGVLSCPDRVIFKGYIGLEYPEAVENLLFKHMLLFKDFKKFAKEKSEIIKAHAEKTAKESGRPYIYLKKYTDKDKKVQQILKESPVEAGLVCVLATQEQCSSFKLKYGEGKPELVHSEPRCLCLYYYYLDKRHGLMHVRIQTWLPFTIQIHVNGHSWLANRLDAEGIKYTREENAFTSIEDCPRAQKTADKWGAITWPGQLNAFARRVNPLLATLLVGMSYYWVTDQFEYSTDIMFRGPSVLRRLYVKLLEFALLALSAEDVLTFLGKKLHGGFAGEILGEYKKRYPGARIKHRVKENWIKMYDKMACVLRIETVINNPYEFRIRRKGTRHGEEVVDWFPMAKGVANLYRYIEICAAANSRYLEALAVVDDLGPAQDEIVSLSQPVHKDAKSYRGFNPFSPRDVNMFTAVMRGEFLLQGFHNADIREHLFPVTRDPDKTRRQRAQVSRLFQILHAHRLIAKIPHTRRWRTTARGQKLMSTVIFLFNKDAAHTYAKAA